MTVLSFLEVKDGFIKLSQQPHNATFEDWVTLPNQIALKQHDSGVIRVKPVKPSTQALVLSCAIHGNETAPIEILSELLSKIVLGYLEPKVNVLFILGNPESMKISQRFVEINMNRLFNGAYKDYPKTEQNKYELERAKDLETYVSQFFNDFPEANKRHLDLHTAIKPSFHQTFAIRPFDNHPITKAHKALLSAAGIEAVLQHNKPSTTFSAFSVSQFGAEAYTLELGKVKPFGENNVADFAKATQCLELLLQDKALTDYGSENVIEYKVVAEIIKHSEEFKFYVSESVENFTPFPQGFLIAEDVDFNYRVAFNQEAVVFPNINVPVGQRVAVMVTKVDN
ncbi:succinylglutamate desuccinylase [Aliikangiella sp. IMCC44632]